MRPKLVATWLAGEILEEYGEEVIGWVEQLPQPLQEQFVHQLRNFGSGPSTFRDILGPFIERGAQFREPSDFNEAAGRFLLAAAAVAPKQVVESIDSLITTATPDELQKLPRRDLVWALEYLLWWPETYERAVRSLFVLAQHESESWANNATGEFVESFQVVLGGTLVPHADRLQWLRSQLETSGSAQVVLIAKAAAAGLNTYHSRMVSGPRGQLEPRDWHPGTEDEILQAHRDSLDLLFACSNRAETGSPESREITKLLISNLRAAISFGLVDHIEGGLRARGWTEEERAAIGGALRDVRRYDEPSEELDRRIGALLDWLAGAGFEERLGVLFATKPWDLIEGRDWEEIPPAVKELVDELFKEPGLLPTAVAVAAEAPEDGSHFQFFMRCAERLSPEAVGEAALAHDPPVWAVLAAALTQASPPDNDEWANEVLRGAIANDVDRFPVLLRSLPLTRTRVDMVLEVVEQGRLTGDAFAELLYGAPIRDLDQADALRLLEAIGSSDSERALEAALGMLDQWLEAHPDDAATAVPTAVDLALKAAKVRQPGSMTSHYLERLFQQASIDYESRAAIWKELALHSDIGSSRDHLPLVQSLLEEKPEQTAELILTVLDEAVSPPYQPWAYSLEEGKLLSAAARATSVTQIWDWMKEHDDVKLRFLLRHTSWAGTEPEPLVREFLLSDRRAELDDEAFVAFFNTLGVVSGPFHLAMERERDRAASWLSALEGTSAEDWAKQLVTEYEARATAEKIRDEEANLDFR